MEPSAKVIADSISPVGHRVTTIEVTMHRMVLAEFNTHRVFSRNSASSRAIPVEKQLDKFVNTPWMPVDYAAEQRGMQGGSSLTGDDLRDAQGMFSDIHDYISSRVTGYLESHPDKSTRLHKSLINRLLEPMLGHTVIVTATDWDGFWEQRCSPLAQPEIRVAADAMCEAYNNSAPDLTEYGEWHLPYFDWEDIGKIAEMMTDGQLEMSPIATAKAISAARCARVSYLTHDGKRDIMKDLELFERLVSARPGHWSPLEHVATPDPAYTAPGNLRGWRQLRHDYEPRT